jgi:ribosomal protein L27
MSKTKITSVTKKNKDKTEKRVTVREIENGYVITQNIEGKKNGEWFYENKEWYSKTNPLDGVDKPLADLID